MAVYITYNIEKISELKECYEINKQWIRSQLPKIDWDSRKEVKQFFEENLGIILQNVKIKNIMAYQEMFSHDTEQYDIINGFVSYLKLKYIIKNYLDCIIRHNENGKVYLRQVGNGQITFPNKQPLPKSPEIEACIITQ
jgi:hypothetical protein